MCASHVKINLRGRGGLRLRGFAGLALVFGVHAAQPLLGAALCVFGLPLDGDAVAALLAALSVPLGALAVPLGALAVPVRPDGGGRHGVLLLLAGHPEVQRLALGLGVALGAGLVRAEGVDAQQAELAQGAAQGRHLRRPQRRPQALRQGVAGVRVVQVPQRQTGQVAGAHVRHAGATGHAESAFAGGARRRRVH